MVSDPAANWQQMEGMGKELNDLFSSVLNWEATDGKAYLPDFTPFDNSNFWSTLQQIISDLSTTPPPNSPQMGSWANIFASGIISLSHALQGQTGPICEALNEFINTPLIPYDGQDVSLLSLSDTYKYDGGIDSTTFYNTLEPFLGTIDSVFQTALQFHNMYG